VVVAHGGWLSLSALSLSLTHTFSGSIAQKQPVQNLYGLSNQTVPQACFPDGFRVSNLGTKLIDKPVQSLYGLVLQSRPHSIPVALE